MWNNRLLSATNNRSTFSLLDNYAQSANDISVWSDVVVPFCRSFSASRWTVRLQRISSSIEMKIKNSGNIRVSFYSKCLEWVVCLRFTHRNSSPCNQTSLELPAIRSWNRCRSGVTRVGVTRGGNCWQLQPYFFLKLTTFFSHRLLESDDVFWPF